MKEQHIVDVVRIECERHERFYVNNHGTVMSRSGVPDFMTMDTTGRLVGIEVKKPGARPTVNQLRRAAEILRSGGRYIVAYDDFTLDAVDAHSLPTWEGRNVAELGVEFEWYEDFGAQRCSVEIVCR